MPFKDYYKILGVSPTATTEDIKRSFRKLAFLYHPDKTAGDKGAEAKFREVKEAYEILIKPVRREGFDYDYKKHYGGNDQNNATRERTSGPTARPQQRNAAAPANGENVRTKKESSSLTATVFLSKAQSINRRYSEKGVLVNEEQLYQEINVFLKKSNIVQLLIWGDVKTNNSIIDQVLATCNLLSYKYIDAIGVRLAKLAGTDNDAIANPGGDGIIIFVGLAPPPRGH